MNDRPTKAQLLAAFERHDRRRKVASVCAVRHPNVQEKILRWFMQREEVINELWRGWRIGE